MERRREGATKRVNREKDMDGGDNGITGIGRGEIKV